MKPKQERFFKALLTLCKEHKVNILDSSIEFQYDDMNYEATVHGAWKLRPDETELEVVINKPKPIAFSILAEGAVVEEVK